MSQINIPIASNTIDAWIVKKIHTVHVMILIINNVLSGFFQSPYMVINNPHTINARLSTHHNTHQVCTETRISPYASINAIKTPHKKLLNVVKKIRANNHGIHCTVRKVVLRSSFLETDSLCTTSTSGTVNNDK